MTIENENEHIKYQMTILGDSTHFVTSIEYRSSACHSFILDGYV